MTDKLNQAIALIKSGQNQVGGQLLSQIVKQDPNNEMAWLWLTKAVVKHDQRIFCLNQALKINPNNQIAQKALKQLQTSQIIPPQPKPPQPTQPPLPISAPPQTQQPTPLPLHVAPSEPQPQPSPEPQAPEPNEADMWDSELPVQDFDPSIWETTYTPSPLSESVESEQTPTTQTDMPHPDNVDYNATDYDETVYDETQSHTTQAIDSDIPPPPNLETKRYTEFIIQQLGKHISHNEIINELCYMSGMDWEKAEAFVYAVEQKSQKKIAQRQAPLLIVVAIFTILGGIVAIMFGLPDVIDYLIDPPSPIDTVDYTVEDLAEMTEFVDPRTYRDLGIAIGETVVGFGMVIGGSVGFFQIGKSLWGKDDDDDDDDDDD